MKQAKRLDNAPPYLFVEIENKIKEAQKKGIDVINLGIGDPDIATPDFIVQKMTEAVTNPTYHCYPEYDGCEEFLQSIAAYFKKRFGIELDPANEIVGLMGSKEGIAHIFFALVNDGDFTLVPDPQYPVYKLATLLTGGIPYPMPLTPENNYLPDLSVIPEEVIKRTKILFVNYPNNPTGAIADLEFYKKIVQFGKKHDILICNDNAYIDFTYDGKVAPSILEVEGALETAIEFHSFSKSFNMTGWRLGYAVGNSDAIAKLKKMKNNIDSGIFTAIQMAGVEALEKGQLFPPKMLDIYTKRKDLVLDYLDKLKWEYTKPQGAFYVWVKVPQPNTSASFAQYLLDSFGVVVAPGNGYGDYGEGYFRISLTISDERIKEAFQRIMKQSKNRANKKK